MVEWATAQKEYDEAAQNYDSAERSLEMARHRLSETAGRLRNAEEAMYKMFEEERHARRTRFQSQQPLPLAAQVLK